MSAERPPDRQPHRLKPTEVKPIFDCAETSQGLLDAFFQICSSYFSTCVLVFFVGDDLVIRRVHGPESAGAAVGARMSRDESDAMGPLRGGGELGAAAVTVEPTDALVRCGAWTTPGEALLLPLVVRGRAAAAVLGGGTLPNAERKDILAITMMASTALLSIVVRRSATAAVSDATRIMSAPIREEEIAARRKRIAMILTALSGAAVIASLVWWFLGGRSPLAVPVADLPGQPNVDPIAIVPIVQRASGLGPQAQLVKIRATVGPEGKTNLQAPGLGDNPWPLRISFASEESVADVDVDRAGVYPPVLRDRGAGQTDCGPCGCDVPAPPPHCSPKQLVDAAHKAGLAPTEPAILEYGYCKVDGPQWTLTVPRRGEIRMSDSSCSPLRQETLHLPPRKLATISKDGRVNPLALLEDARSQASLTNPVLVRIELWLATRDGTIDVLAAGRRGRAEYIFADPADPSGSRIRRVALDSEGLSVVSRELVKTPPRAAPLPRCTITKLWRSAIFDAPESSLVHVLYEADPASENRGLWTIELAATAVHQTRQDVVCAAWE